MQMDSKLFEMEMVLQEAGFLFVSLQFSAQVMETESETDL